MKKKSLETINLKVLFHSKQHYFTILKKENKKRDKNHPGIKSLLPWGRETEIKIH